MATDNQRRRYVPLRARVVGLYTRRVVVPFVLGAVFFCLPNCPDRPFSVYRCRLPGNKVAPTREADHPTSSKMPRLRMCGDVPPLALIPSYVHSLNRGQSYYYFCTGKHFVDIIFPAALWPWG